jgi:putative hemolysin
VLTLPVELLILALLILANGLLAMAETAVVSARKSRLQARASAGDPRAARALALAAQPSRFLALVQFWLTLSGLIAGVLGGAKIARPLAGAFRSVPAFAPAAMFLALLCVTLGLGMLMLLFGELVPKRIALAYPEAIAGWLAGFVRALSWVASPFLWVLEQATNRIARLVGVRPPSAADRVSEEEVRALVEQGLHAGVFIRAEKEMVEGVLALDRLQLTAVMTPRPKIVFLNLEDPDDTNWRKIVTSGHSYFPVFQRNRDQIVGLVSVKALWAHSAIGLPSPLRNLLVPPLFVPETMTAIQALEKFKQTGRHIAVVTDEFGGVQGLVTLIDIFEAIVGDLPEKGQAQAPAPARSEDGSWVLDATLPIRDFKELIGISDTLPQEKQADFQTIGGFVMTYFGRIPAVGDRFEWQGWRFEVLEMDRNRVDRIKVERLTGRPNPAAASRGDSA